MFVDPFGLISDEEAQQQSNILSVIRAYHDGFVTKEQMEANVIENGGVPGIALNVPVRSQKPYAMRCTPTSGSMVDTYYDSKNSLSTDEIADIANKKHNINIDDPRTGGLMPEEMNGIVGYTLKQQDMALPLYSTSDEPSVAGELQNGNPLLVVIDLPLGEGLHTMVITGYMKINGVEGVIINDPATGTQSFFPYTQFASEYGVTLSYTTGTWIDTYTTKKN